LRSNLGFAKFPGMTKPSYVEALERVGILSALARFDPRVAGTVPLGLDLPMSDVDVLCYAPDPRAFTSAVWAAFSQHEGFRIWQWTGVERPVVASFAAEGWVFEVFGPARPVSEQWGWRHFLVERRLLELGGARFRAAVMDGRRSGMKTEPAFAAALNLSGDPYQALLDMERWSDDALASLLAAADP
jgi:hypothetical protein